MPGEGNRVGDSHPEVFFLSTGRRNDPRTDISLSSKPLRTGKHRVQHSESPSFLPLSVSLTAAWDGFPAGLISSNCLQLSGQLHLSPGGDGPSGSSWELMPKELLLLPVARHHPHTSSPLLSTELLWAASEIQILEGKQMFWFPLV